MSTRPIAAAPASLQPLLTTAEVAAHFRVHPKTILRYRRSAGLPCHLVGGRLRFDPAQVSRWLQDRKEA
jgi:excisionase family DNA binding protein